MANKQSYLIIICIHSITALFIVRIGKRLHAYVSKGMFSHTNLGYSPSNQPPPPPRRIHYTSRDTDKAQTELKAGQSK